MVISVACTQVGWVPVQGPSNSYSVQMPAAPERSDRTSPSGIPVRKFSASHDGCSFLLSSNPVPTYAAALPHEALDRAVIALTRRPTEKQGLKFEVVRSAEIFRGSVPGRELLMIDNTFGYQLQYRIYVFRNQLIHMMADGQLDRCSAADVERFFESLTFHPAASLPLRPKSGSAP